MNLSEKAPASHAQAYLIALPTGTEGPYSIDELRAHLRSGRLNPADRVIGSSDKRSRPLTEIIPEAESLAVKSDRIARRKSTDSGRMTVEAAPGRAATDSQARRYRTPLPIAGATGDAPHPSATAGAKAGARPPKPALVALGVTTLAACMIAICWQVGLFDSYAGGHPGLRWRATFHGSAGGPWTLILNGHDLETISPTKQSTHIQVRQDFVAGARMQLTMSPPHPELGPVLTIASTNPAEVALENDKGSAEVLP